LPINIHEYRVGDAPKGFWRYVYDPYPQGRPVVEASEDRGRPVFAAYRAQAPGTIPIYRHRYVYSSTESPGVTDDESTPVAFELNDQPVPPDRPPPHGSVMSSGGGVWIPYANKNGDQPVGSVRVFWAFPASSGGGVPSTVAVHEHRLEVDVLDMHRHALPRDWTLEGRCLVYLKYSVEEYGGPILDGHEDGRDLTGEAESWWRTAQEDRYTIDFAYARYTRRVAFYAYRAQ
jgi:hypothetical protein